MNSLLERIDEDDSDNFQEHGLKPDQQEVIQ